MSAWPSKGKCRNSKNFPPLNLVNKVSRPKYVFSRDMFCLYHISARIHSVYRLSLSLKSYQIMILEVWIQKPSQKLTRISCCFLLYFHSSTEKVQFYGVLVSWKKLDNTGQKKLLLCTHLKIWAEGQRL